MTLLRVLGVPIPRSQPVCANLLACVLLPPLGAHPPPRPARAGRTRRAWLGVGELPPATRHPQGLWRELGWAEEAWDTWGVGVQRPWLGL